MNKNKKPLILVSNDDGYNFNGIKTLTAVAREFGEVMVVAPMQHQSGKGSAITVSTPLRAIPVKSDEDMKMYLVNGTPTDCAKLALDQLLEGRTPDLMLSGINHGLNTGVSTIYSGTMGVAFEGCVHGVPSVAFSYDDYSFNADMNPCIPIVRHVISRVLTQGLPPDICLNVNIPRIVESLKGIKVTTTCMGRWINEFERRTDPHGVDYYWLMGEYERHSPNDDSTDLYWIDRGWATATPCKIDQTDRDAMHQISLLLS